MKTLQERVDYVLDYFSDKTESRGCHFKFLQNWTTPNGYMTFEAGDIVEVGFIDSKYECIFFHKKVRGDLKIKRSFVRENMETVGHPVMIGDVLDKMNNKPLEIAVIQDFEPQLACADFLIEITAIWGKCGLSKSLNDIFQLIGEQIQDGYAMDLLEFLESITPEQS